MITHIYIIKIPHHQSEWLVGTDASGRCLMEQELNSGYAQNHDLGQKIDIWQPYIVDELDVRASQNYINNTSIDDALQYSKFNEKQVGQVLKYKCHCDMVSIMKQGCQCGGT